MAKKKQTSVPKKVLEAHRRIWGGRIPSGALEQLKKEYRKVRKCRPLQLPQNEKGFENESADAEGFENVGLAESYGRALRQEARSTHSSSREKCAAAQTQEVETKKRERFLKMEKQTGNIVTYEIPRTPQEIARRRKLTLALICVAVLACALGFFFLASFGVGTSSILSFLTAGLSVVVGTNTVAYEYPVTGATAPTAAVMSKHQSLSAVVTGDGSATTFTIVHNWGLSTAQLADAFPWVEYEEILAAGYTAAPLVTTRNANNVVFTCTAFTGAGLRVRLQRPWSALT